jgi:hypothetical protein
MLYQKSSGLLDYLTVIMLLQIIQNRTWLLLLAASKEAETPYPPTLPPKLYEDMEAISLEEAVLKVCSLTTTIYIKISLTNTISSLPVSTYHPFLHKCSNSVPYFETRFMQSTTDEKLCEVAVKFFKKVEWKLIELRATFDVRHLAFVTEICPELPLCISEAIETVCSKA